jgi:hypothetical protein
MDNVSLYMINGFVTICYFLSLFFSFRTINNPWIPPYMRGFYWYSVVGAIVCLLFWYSRLFSEKELFVKINLASLLFHYWFLGNFFKKILVPSNNKIGNIFLFLSLFILIVFVIINLITKTTSLSFTTANFVLLVLSLGYYFQLFQKAPNQILFNEPAFWVVTGVFIAMGISLPVILFSDFIRMHKTFTKEEYYFLNLIAGIPNAIMHIFFIKAYVCSTRVSIRSQSL